MLALLVAMTGLGVAMLVGGVLSFVFGGWVLASPLTLVQVIQQCRILAAEVFHDVRVAHHPTLAEGHRLYQHRIRQLILA